ncbi:hypothetical protein [Tunturiibacter gelidiferens]|uniref:hypothetical protein n=1 Tax=Tunturiibacter gelidiferens TaxID=3069689 RepID=UPI003D9BC2CF
MVTSRQTANDRDRRRLRRYGFGIPEISISEHHKADAFALHSPFHISMGLGFTDQVDFALTDACENWMQVTREPDSGDAVSLHEKLKPQKRLKYFAKPAPSEIKDFFVCCR